MEAVEDAEDSLEESKVLVMPGEVITREQGFLRGHGTYVGTPSSLSHSSKTEGDTVDFDPDDEQDPTTAPSTKALISSVAGVVMRVNKLISVVPLRSRYTGDIGDVVVGRVVEVGNKRWKVDIRGRQSATLQLGSINLPGGALRRRTLQDQLQMRSLFSENDLLSAEVASFYQDGGVAIHTRSMRYGKLENGQLVHVPPGLVKRVKQHFVTLSCGVELVLGHNGSLWLSIQAEQVDTAQSRMSEEMELKKSIHRDRTYSREERTRMARVRNAIITLAAANKTISPEAITKVYEETLARGIQPKAMLAMG